VIMLPNEAADLILDERVKAMQGDQTALDGHALYCREKFAYALTVLDGRVQMTLEDWQLSGIAADVSTYTRETMQEALKAAAEVEAIDRGELRGVEMEAADIARTEQQIKRSQRVLRWLLHKLDASPDGISQAELGHAITSRDRSTLQLILQAGHELIRSELVNGSVVWYRS